MLVAQRRENFALEYGLSLVEVARFAKWGVRRANLLVKECNGEPRHPKALSDDKGESAELWGADAEVLEVWMRSLALGWRFAVDFGVGLYPALRRGESWVHFPWD
jgi:hypothetical protein